MANAYYVPFKPSLLNKEQDLNTDEVRVLLIDGADYTPNLTTAVDRARRLRHGRRRAVARDGRSVRIPRHVQSRHGRCGCVARPDLSVRHDDRSPDHAERREHQHHGSRFRLVDAVGTCYLASR